MTAGNRIFPSKIVCLLLRGAHTIFQFHVIYFHVSESCIYVIAMLVRAIKLYGREGASEGGREFVYMQQVAKLQSKFPTLKMYKMHFVKLFRIRHACDSMVVLHPKWINKQTNGNSNEGKNK